MPEDFDISKASEVEGLSDADFSVWRSAKHSEVRRKNKQHLKSLESFLQVVHYVSGNLSAPGRTLITLSLEAYIQSADTLRQLADVSPSDRRTRFDLDKKKETLRQLRSLFENGRKLFNFACVNASTYFYND